MAKQNREIPRGIQGKKAKYSNVYVISFHYKLFSVYKIKVVSWTTEINVQVYWATKWEVKYFYL